jgi:hypothetical protein
VSLLFCFPLHFMTDSSPSAESGGASVGCRGIENWRAFFNVASTLPSPSLLDKTDLRSSVAVDTLLKTLLRNGNRDTRIFLCRLGKLSAPPSPLSATDWSSTTGFRAQIDELDDIGVEDFFFRNLHSVRLRVPHIDNGSFFSPNFLPFVFLTSLPLPRGLGSRRNDRPRDQGATTS